MTSGAIILIEDLLVRRESAGSVFELYVPHLQIHEGDRIGVAGPSGCGKSTLLDVLALVLPPTAVGRFEVRLNGEQAIDVAAAARQGGSTLESQRRHIGYVLQLGGLLPFLTVDANIRLPLDILGQQDAGRVRAVAGAVGVETKLWRHPGTLSAGERQRVALARGIVHDPPLLLADEPTAALDPNNADIILTMMIREATVRNCAVVVVSHDLERLSRFELRRLRQSFVQAEGSSVVRSVITGDFA